MQKHVIKPYAQNVLIGIIFGLIDTIYFGGFVLLILSIIVSISKLVYDTLRRTIAVTSKHPLKTSRRSASLKICALSLSCTLSSITGISILNARIADAHEKTTGAIRQFMHSNSRLPNSLSEIPQISDVAELAKDGDSIRVTGTSIFYRRTERGAILYYRMKGFFDLREQYFEIDHSEDR